MSSAKENTGESRKWESGDWGDTGHLKEMSFAPLEQTEVTRWCLETLGR